MNKDILICGVGGQGTVLASRVIAAAAMEEGYPVHSAETIGMAQRGGSVTSHVRIGENAFSPLIPFGSADMMLAFEPAEAVRNLRYLRKDGLAVVSTSPVRPVTESLKSTGYDGKEMADFLRRKCECLFVSGEEACRPFGSVKFLNIILLGLAVGSGRLEIGEETVLKQIEKYVPARFLEANRQAFRAGLDMSRS
ncbi:MAG: indolepyruvate oxidoreductase subunit beta [Clostridiales bacterium]|nr:indolepyruvate oxidoreductase subunit beta [Clostridiales bacterium]